MMIQVVFATRSKTVNEVYLLKAIRISLPGIGDIVTMKFCYRRATFLHSAVSLLRGHQTE